MHRYIAGAWLVAVALAVGACETEYAAFEEAKNTNTAEAYHAFLEQYPDGVNKAAAVERLDNLDWAAAAEENTAAAYEGYLAAHPEGIHVTEAELEAPKLAWQTADFSGDLAGVQAFLERYGNTAYAKKAEARKALLELAPKHVEVGEMQFEALEGGKWRVATDVKNVGEVDVIEAKFRVHWSDPDGRVARSKEWYLVAQPNPRYDADEELNKPLAPGETRTFEFTFRRKEAAENWPEDAAHTGVGLVELKTAEAAAAT